MSVPGVNTGIPERESAGRQQGQPPNLVILFPDQFRGQALGFRGADPVMTPNLDALAAESIVLHNAVVNYPLCSPARAMLMTGKYPHNSGVIDNLNSQVARYDIAMKQSERTWSDVLSDRGYSLGYIGKWHLDIPVEPYADTSNNRGDNAWNAWTPPERRHGFDYWHANGSFNDHLRPMYWETNDGKFDFRFYDEYSPTHEANKAIEYIENRSGNYRQDDKPFALVVAMNPPHSGHHDPRTTESRPDLDISSDLYYLTPPEYKKMYADIPEEKLLAEPNIPPAGSKMGGYYRRNIRDYYAAVTAVDHEIGRVLSALEAQGLKENTVVLVTSDHGNLLGMHNEKAKNTWFEESMLVPFLLRYPARLAPRSDDLLISFPDIYPTLLDLMGYADDIPPQVDGVSHAQYLITGEGQKPTSQLYQRIGAGDPKGGNRGVRTERYTLGIGTGDGYDGEYLFDRQEDPHQINNIAAQRPDIVAKLKEELRIWLRKAGDPWEQGLDQANPGERKNAVDPAAVP